MGFFDRLTRHEPLFHGMADRLGVDIGDWIGRSPARAGDYRAAMMSCAGCRSGAACEVWQASHDRAEHAPDFCRNRHLLDTLTSD